MTNQTAPQYMVVLDMGTSSCRAAAVTKEGRIIAHSSYDVAPIRTPDGGSYYEAESLLQAQQYVMQQVLQAVDISKIKGIGVCSQRSTVVLWDKRDGKSLAPILTWEDGRAALQAQRAEVSQAEIHQLTGLYKTPYFSAPKIAWCLENSKPVQEALQEGVLCVGPLASFFIYQWTKGKTFATDLTLAQRTLLLDIHTGNWSEKLARAFRIPLSVLPSLKASVDDYGSYEYQGHQIPICVCVADQQAASYALEEEQTRINYGTGAFVLRHIGNTKIVCDGLLTSLTCNFKHQKPQFLLEGPVTSAGSAYKWLAAEKGIDINMAQLDLLCKQSSHPVRILPALGGLGAPYWNFRISPTVENVTSQTTSADWAAGLTQAIAYLIADIGAYLKKNNVPIKEKVWVSGGLAGSRYLLQFQADILQTTLTLQTETEGTLMGLAGLGFHTHFTTETFEITPQLSPAQATSKYKDWQQFVQTCLTSIKKPNV